MEMFLTDYSRPVNDGPYIFYQEDSLVTKQIIADSLLVKKINKKNDPILIKPLGHRVTIQETYDPVIKLEYENIDKFFVVSDIHGQYQLFCDLLVNNNITDADLNWSWGKGHLVINGDVFDRGEGVTEALWLIYSLEQQAEAVGGKVHFLLGNHELMIIENDLRYVLEKYIRSAYLLQCEITELYSDQTVLGRWLRSRPAFLKINDNLIVHAGISPELIARSINFADLNQQINKIMTGKNIADSDMKLLSGSLGPFWYRGYFQSGSSYELLGREQYNDIIATLAVTRIIVGHTTMDDVYSFFENSLIMVDASIKLGKSGKGLLYEAGSFKILDTNGALSELQQKQ